MAATTRSSTSSSCLSPTSPFALDGLHSITLPIDANRTGPRGGEMPAAPLALKNDMTASPGVIWRAKAACRGCDTGIFFPLADEAAEPAKAICASCPVREECLEYALATRQDDGVWGGLTDLERRRLRRRRGERARRAS